MPNVLSVMASVAISPIKTSPTQKYFYPGNRSLLQSLLLLLFSQGPKRGPSDLKVAGPAADG